MATGVDKNCDLDPGMKVAVVYRRDKKAGVEDSAGQFRRDQEDKVQDFVHQGDVVLWRRRGTERITRVAICGVFVVRIIRPKRPIGLWSWIGDVEGQEILPGPFEPGLHLGGIGSSFGRRFCTTQGLSPTNSGPGRTLRDSSGRGCFRIDEGIFAS